MEILFGTLISTVYVYCGHVTFLLATYHTVITGGAISKSDASSRCHCRKVPLFFCACAELVGAVVATRVDREEKHSNSNDKDLINNM